MDNDNVVSIGKELGLKDAELRAWVEQERVRLRDERAEERSALKEELALKQQLIEQERAAAREKAEQQQKLLEQEMKVLELKLRLQECAATAQATENSTSSNASASQNVCSPHKLIPPFNEARDDLDAYLQRFERVALCQEWPREKWALSLSLCMTGEALTVIGRMDPTAVLDYDTLKSALLQRFHYTAEGYREKFRAAKPEDKETGMQYAARLAGYFDHWLELAKVDKSFSALRDLIIAEQFVKGCSPALRVFLKERNRRTIQELSQAADNFVEAQSLLNLGRERPEKEVTQGSGLRADQMKKAPRGDNRCFLCGKEGHRAAECWSRKKASSPVHGHDSEQYSAGRGERSEASCLVSLERTKAKPAENQEYVILKDGEKVPIVSTIVSRGHSEDMPVAKGFLENCPVTVLRDTGCDTVVVRQVLVPKKKLTGTYRPVLLLDGTVRQLPEAMVFLDTPFFRGKVRAQCMQDSLYDVVIGNIKGAVPLNTLKMPNDISKAKQKRPSGASIQDMESTTLGTPAVGRGKRQHQPTVRRVPNQPRFQRGYFQQRNTGRRIRFRPGSPTPDSGGIDNFRAQMDQSPSLPQPSRFKSSTRRHVTKIYQRRIRTPTERDFMEHSASSALHKRGARKSYQ
uniref:CCHC-type domain-containing protein n=1 Tax=Rhipicephalus pulchellus TaxID=72859 RepID=L7LYC0_RHIPC